MLGVKGEEEDCVHRAQYFDLGLGQGRFVLSESKKSVSPNENFTYYLTWGFFVRLFVCSL